MRHTKILALAMALLMLAVPMMIAADNGEADATSSVSYRLYGMGQNTYGQQGNGTSGSTTYVKTPTQIGSTLGSIEKVVCSTDTTFFLTSDGKLYGMGKNDYGQQGDGTTTNVTTPTQIGSTIADITDVVCSLYTTFFLTSDGKLYGMGRNNGGQQGDGTTTNVTTPTQIGSTLGSIEKVVCSEFTTFFLTSDGKLYGIGSNTLGQQGDGTTTNVTTPTQIGSTLGSIEKVVCTQSTTFFLTSDGKLFGMGQNTYGQQGDGTTTNVTTPTQIGSTIADITDVVCSQTTTFFLTSDGKLYGMGQNSNGQQGNGVYSSTNVTTPTQIGSTIADITDVVCSKYATFFLTSDGKLYGTGRGNEGQQGDGTTTNVTTPTQIGSDLGNITDVVCSEFTTFFLTSDGKLFGMGQNTYGQQGDSTTVNVTTPTQIGSGLGTVILIAVADSEESSNLLKSSSSNVSNNTTFFLVDPSTTVTIAVNDSSYGEVSSATIDASIGDTISTSGNTLTIGSTTITANPKTATDQYTFTFGSWTTPSNTVTEGMTITANFTATVNQYTVTIAVNDDDYGSVSPTSVTADYGTAVSASGNTLTVGSSTSTATPATATAQYTYALGSWTIPSATVTGNMTITANFTATVNQYTVTIAVNDDDYGSVSPTSVTADYGTAVSASGNTLTIGTALALRSLSLDSKFIDSQLLKTTATTVTATGAVTAQYTYVVDSWTIPSATVTGDMTVTVNFVPTLNYYTITWMYDDTTVLDTETLAYGTMPSHEDPEEREGYIFSGWTPTIATVTGDQTYTPIWSKQVTVTFDASTNGGYVSTTSETVLSGLAIGELPTATRTNYEFLGWFTAADGGTEITADTVVESDSDFTIYAQFELMKSAQTMKMLIMAIITLLFIAVIVAVVGKYNRSSGGF